MMEWHGGGPERREFHFRMDPEALERISEIESERVLEGMDIEKIVETALHEAERRPAELEQRLAEMEKRLAEMQKRLAELQKKN
jgi:TolA-binding protein